MASAEVPLSEPPSSPDSVWPTLLSADHEAGVFWRLRYLAVRGIIRGMLARSRLHVLLVTGLSVLFWIGLYWMFRDGFGYLLGSFRNVIESIFNMFFLTLMGLLAVSSSILLYSNAYRAREAQFLMTMPARDQRLFLYKFQETIWFCSWGFLLLGSPMLFAYGQAVSAPWYYYALLPFYMGAFVCIPGSLGAIACLAIVYWLPTLRKHALAAATVAGLIAAIWLTWSLTNLSAHEALTPHWFWELSQRLDFARQSYLPSNWLSSGLLHAAQPPETIVTEPSWSVALKFCAVLIANALLFLLLAYRLAQRIYRSGFQRMQGEFNQQRKAGVAWIDRTVQQATWFLPRMLRPLIVKDVRLFRRDPLQWSQVLLFLSLLGLYFANIRRFVQQDEALRWWVNLIGFLNLAVVGLILSTFMTRFVFPMLSLEGRRFWILARLPVRREAILWSKFLFAAIGSAVPCCALIFLSDMMLPVPTFVVWIHQLDCLLMCVGLSAIAVGLGATVPDLHEPSPSKIAAGFGGTLNLVLSAIFVFAVVGVTAVPCDLRIRSGSVPEEPPTASVDEPGVALAKRLNPPKVYRQRNEATFWKATLARPEAVAYGAALATFIGFLATVIPLRAGFRAFRRLEL